MTELHSLLRRQMKRYFGNSDTIPPELCGFLSMVNDAYHQSDSDRSMLERSLELTSQELITANAEVRAVFARLISSSVDGIMAFDRNCCYTVGIRAWSIFLASRQSTYSENAPSMFSHT